MRRSLISIVTFVLLGAGPSGCVLAPRGLQHERQRLADAGRDFVHPIDERAIPTLAEDAGWRALLQHAFLSNGELEAAYREWQAAVLRVAQAAGYPNTNVSLGFEYLFSGERMKGWDRTTLTLGFDPMQNLSLPPKVVAAGRVAFAEAQAAGKRFEAAKFALQRRVLALYYDYALAAERARIHGAHVALLRVAAETAISGVAGGGEQRTLLESTVALRRAEDMLRTAEADLPALRAQLNAVIGREPDAPLTPPGALPLPRAVPTDDAALLRIAVDNNPELAALAHAVRGQRDAVALARLQYWPDINPFVGITGGIEQVIGAAVTLSTTLPQIRAAIDEALVMQRRSEALARQARLDRSASFVAALAGLRDNERQLHWLDSHVTPAAELLLASARQANLTGGSGLVAVIDGERTLLDLRLLAAEIRVTREKRLAELEALAGVDIETLMPVEDVATPLSPAYQGSVDKLSSALANGYPPLEKEGQGGFGAVAARRSAQKSPLTPVFQRRGPDRATGGNVVARPPPGPLLGKEGEAES